MGVESEFGQFFLTTKLKDLMSWGRKNSLWPYPFGTACCAIELMARGDQAAEFRGGCHPINRFAG